MPDIFGFPTPEEVRAQTSEQSRVRRTEALRSSNDPEFRGGVGAGVLLQGLGTFLGTRNARKQEAAKLQEQGVSADVAQERAKAKIPYGNAQVRKAARMQPIADEANSLMDAMLADGVHMDRARGVNMLLAAGKLKAAGFRTEAANMRAAGMQVLKQYEIDAAEMANLKARTRASAASAAKTEAELPTVGMTPFEKNIYNKERVQAMLDDPDSEMTPQERQQAIEHVQHLEGKILKDQYIRPVTGRTEWDMRTDATFMRDQLKQYVNDSLRVSQLDDAIKLIDATDLDDMSKIAGLYKGFIGFTEGWLGLEPTEDQKAFLQRFTDAKARPTIIAAMVRHALTGAQMSHFEIKYLEPFLPAPGDNKTTMLAKLRAVREYTQLDVDKRLELISNPYLTAQFFVGGPGASAGGSTEEVLPGTGDSALDSLLQKAGAR